MYIKPSYNKKGQKIFQLHHFLNTFSQLPAVKQDSKNGAARKFFAPSYFDPALPRYYLNDLSSRWSAVSETFLLSGIPLIYLHSFWGFFLTLFAKLGKG